MRVAVFAGELSRLKNVRDSFYRWKRTGIVFEEEYFLSMTALLDSAEQTHYDIIFVYKEQADSIEEHLLRRFRKLELKSSIIFICGDRSFYRNFLKPTYMAQFNGKTCVLNMDDICFFESYDRKTSVVTHEKKIRITARLDIEEQKLSNYLFARINRWNLINIRQIRAMEGDIVHMRNGIDLYVSSSRRKDFLEKYEQYAAENYRIL